MTQETKKKIHRLYGIVVAAAAVLAGVCLIAACCNIYYSGLASDASQIYTRQIVAESFSKIALPVYACLFLVIGGMALDLALPAEKKKEKPEKNLHLILQKLQEKTDLKNCNTELQCAIAKEQKKRNIFTLASVCLLAAGMISFLRYACDSTHWDTNSTPSMVTAMIVMLVDLLLPFAVITFATYRSRKSVEREITLMREAATQAPKEAETTPKKTACNCKANILRVAIIIIGLALVVFGACNEGTADILTKAVNICTECVGLG